MARQDVVRALVPDRDVDRLRAELTDDLEVQHDHIELAPAPPDTYRDEAPDLELRHLVRAGRVRVAIGAALGGVVGAAVALAIPALREWAPFSVVLLAFGLAWGAGAAVAARTVQVHRDEGPRGEELHEVSPADSQQLMLMTIRVDRERAPIVDHLMDRGVTLLDSHHPRVGHHEPGARPAGPDNGAAGPSET